MITVLKPAIPIEQNREYAGWIGGNPELPDGHPWPVIEDEAAIFLCQIDCSKLPRTTCRGLAPTSGWLRLFVYPKLECDIRWVTGVWTEVRGKERVGPNMAEAGWFHSVPWDWPVLNAPLRWPLELVTRSGPTEGLAFGFEDYRHIRNVDLAVPHFQPFNLELLDFLLAQLQDDLQGWSSFPDRWRLRHDVCTIEDAYTLQMFEIKILEANQKFLEQKQETKKSIDRGEEITVIASQLIDHLSAINVPRIGIRDEAPTFEVSTTPLSQSPPIMLSSWPQTYLEALYEHAKILYVKSPDLLPSVHREFFETVWLADAELSSINMGGEPRGFTYGDFGPNASFEILAQFTSNQLTNFVWGDCRNLLVGITPENLRSRKFEHLEADVII